MNLPNRKIALVCFAILLAGCAQETAETPVSGQGAAPLGTAMVGGHRVVVQTLSAQKTYKAFHESATERNKGGDAHYARQAKAIEQLTKCQIVDGKVSEAAGTTIASVSC